MKKRQTLSPVTALFDNEQVARATHDDQTYYAAEDIVRALVETDLADEYWADLKSRDAFLDAATEQVPFVSETGDTILRDALTAPDVLRMVQAIESPRAERIKLWLAEAGQQRIEEAENPELALVRAREAYERKGYSHRWIDKRLRAVSTRHELTSEWARRGVTESDEYRALTNELTQAGFGMDVEAYRRYKNLSGSQTLRDHMTDLELVLTMLGESAAASLARDRDAQGFEALRDAARDAGDVVATTRKSIERHSGQSVVNPDRPWKRRVA